MIDVFRPFICIYIYVYVYIYIYVYIHGMQILEFTYIDMFCKCVLLIKKHDPIEKGPNSLIIAGILVMP